MSTESFILDTPNRVIPSTSPCRSETRRESAITASRDSSMGCRTHLVGHDISEETRVSRIDSETVRGHGVVNLLDDRRSCSLDSEHRRRLHDLDGENHMRGRVSRLKVRPARKSFLRAYMDGRRLGSDDTLHVHDRLQTVTLDEQVVLGLLLLTLTDHRSVDSGDALHEIRKVRVSSVATCDGRSASSGLTLTTMSGSSRLMFRRRKYRPSSSST